MALKFVPVTTIQKTINVQIPGDFGKTVAADFDATFRRMPVSEARELVKQIQENSTTEEEVLRHHVVNLKGIKDSDGKEVEFSAELLNRLIDEAYIRGPLLAGFLDVNYGLDKLRTKN